MNALLYASWLTYVRISLGEIPGSGIAGSEDIHMFSFSRYCQIVFKVVAPVCTLTRSVQGSCCCAALPVLSITGLTHFGYSGGCGMVSHCGGPVGRVSCSSPSR